MIFNAEFKPWLTAQVAKTVLGGSKFAITGVYFDKNAAQLIATDGRVLTRYPVEDFDDDDAGIIPVEALKEAAKLGRKQGRAGLSIKGGEAVLWDGRKFPLIAGPYPNYEQVIPAHGLGTRHAKTARLHLNPALLEALYSALAGDKEGALLEFQLDDENDAKQTPITVSVGALPLAVIMPMKISTRYTERVDDIEKAHEFAALFDAIDAGNKAQPKA